MDIGILVPATVETQDITGIAQRVEGLGFESLWIPEHPVIPVGFKIEVPGGGTLPEHYNRWAAPVCCADDGGRRHHHAQAGHRYLFIPGARAAHHRQR